MRFKTQLFFLLLIFSLFLIHSCSLFHDDPPLFESVPSTVTNINFENNLNSDLDFNVYKYRNFYNGGGVAVGDINNDGLPDIYLVANRGPNKLYINKGNFAFEDVTEKAGVAGTKPWSTGASFADINSDGLLDIYVSNSGEFDIDERRNELFINNGDGTFTEAAEEYGIDDPGFAIYASFFDYDLDGDLDMYLLNNSDASITSFDLSDNQRNVRDEFGGDKLFRNDNGNFTDVSEEAGIFGSEIAFGLSATISDIDRDSYPDIYVANDFFEHDYLYMNNGDGTFREVLKDKMNSISASSMGTDIADLTNNGWPDIYVSDMLPQTDARTKIITTFEDWQLFSEKIGYGYHSQVTRNTLHLNNGDGTFSEVGRLAEVQASDWSWAVLIADYDLNGHNDVFITNGLVQDITNLDYVHEINSPDMMRSIISENNIDFEQLIDMIPSNPIPNVLYANYGELQFENKAEEWGLGEPGYSSGAAWADLDNDGDLDLIVNDVNNPVKIYKNSASRKFPDRGRLTIKLKGQEPNTQAIGATLEVWADSSYWYREHYLQRGYQSSVEPGLFVGTGSHSTIDSLKLTWPDGRISKEFNINTPAELTLKQENAKASEKIPSYIKPAFITGDIKNEHLVPSPLFTDITEDINLNWAHKKNDYVDFNREHLLVHMRSTEGPALCTGDINRDGLDDIYIGGGRNQAGIIVVQDENSSSGFSKTDLPVFQDDASSEDTDCTFFDANGDDHLDLYVTSGGNSYSTGSSALFDRLYINDGSGNFVKSQSFTPPGGFSSNSTVTAADFNNDGATDLFVGKRLELFAVGLPVSGYLLINDGSGNFSDESQNWSEQFSELGMITDSKKIDWNDDGMQDLVIVGEWMSPRVFINRGSSFEEITEQLNLSNMRGLWNTVHVSDADGDRRKDLILGNHGLNSHFRTNSKNPLKMWVGDFQNDGITDQFLSRSFDQKDYPFVLKHDFTDQIPELLEKYPDYKSYSDKTVQEIFTQDQLNSAKTLQVDLLESVIIYNKEDGPEIETLPLRAQFSPIFGIWSTHLYSDRTTIVTTGNLLEAKPMAGPYDASYGTAINVNQESKSVNTIPPTLSGLSVSGSGREIVSLENADNQQILIIARNNNTPLFYKVNS